MISVCMATYNGEKFVKEQIESILGQISNDDEVIISDDGSSDGTLAIIKSIDDPRIKIFHNNRERGFKNNFENALNKAQGDYIFLSDQDDVWLPNKVKTALERLRDYDLIVHDAKLIDGNGYELGINYQSTLHNKTNFWFNLWETRFLGCCMVFKKEVLNECLPFPKYINAHDYWIGMYSLVRNRVCFIPDILICYRRHGHNVSPSSEKSNNSLYYKIVRKRFLLLMAVCAKILSCQIGCIRNCHKSHII